MRKANMDKEMRKSSGQERFYPGVDKRGDLTRGEFTYLLVLSSLKVELGAVVQSVEHLFFEL